MAEEGCCHDGGWRIGTKGAPADVGFLREHVRVDDLHTEGGAAYKNTIFSRIVFVFVFVIEFIKRTMARTSILVPPNVQLIKSR